MSPKAPSTHKNHPYINTLSKEDRKWLRMFDRADSYGSEKYFKKLGASDSEASAMVKEANDRRNSYRRDLMNVGKREIFEESDDEFTNKESVGESAVHVPYEEIIDAKREITKRTLHEGYGYAPNLKEGVRVQLAIEGHRLQGCLGVVIRKRHSEWLIQFDNVIQGYFNARELFQVQQHQQVG